jgi:hypothetical protein
MQTRGAFDLKRHKYCFIFLCMRTTIDVPDDLFTAAKKLAAELRVPLRRLIEEGLRERIKPRNSRAQKKVSVRWITVEGALASDVDLSNRAAMHTRLRRIRP